MTLELLQIDAFSDGPFTGNPAAVVLMEEELDAQAMQNIAEENNLSETAFVLEHPAEPGVFALRWFTPTIEVELCGHATLAAASALHVAGRTRSDEIRFRTKSGVLFARVQDDGRIAIDLPAERSTEPVSAERLAELERALDARLSAAFEARYALAVLESESAVAAIVPDRATLERFGVPVVATAESGAPNIDFVSRFFAPTFGVLEDPVTGSAHCQLVPYWAAQRGREHMLARQISKRGGTLECRLAGDRVELIGAARTYLRGAISL